MGLFLISCLALIIGYIFYGLLAEKIFGISEKKTPAVQKADGVDFIPLPPYKIFLIQFLNIAGLGPVFGAIQGAMYGPVCLFWIVLGSIFAGAVHDYFSGMISLRHDGKSATFLIEQYLGRRARYIGMVLIIFMLLLRLLLLGLLPQSLNRRHRFLFHRDLHPIEQTSFIPLVHRLLLLPRLKRCLHSDRYFFCSHSASR